MIYAVLAAVIAWAVILPLVAALAVHTVRDRRVLVRRRVLVNLKSGNAIGGVIVDNRGKMLTLKDAEIIEHGSNAVPADGEVLVERVHVDFIQAL